MFSGTTISKSILRRRRKISRAHNPLFLTNGYFEGRQELCSYSSGLFGVVCPHASDQPAVPVVDFPSAVAWRRVEYEDLVLLHCFEVGCVEHLEGSVGMRFKALTHNIRRPCRTCRGTCCGSYWACHRSAEYAAHRCASNAFFSRRAC
jgi:hypothetical protein